MKALTIHKFPSPTPDDFCWAVEGEIAVPSTIVCGNTNCGCDRSHSGLSSHQASTTVMVRDIDLSLDDLATACLGFLEAAGWADELDNTQEVAGEMVEDLTEIAAQYPIGTILRPAFDRSSQEWRYTEATSNPARHARDW